MDLDLLETNYPQNNHRFVDYTHANDNTAVRTQDLWKEQKKKLKGLDRIFNRVATPLKLAGLVVLVALTAQMAQDPSTITALRALSTWWNLHFIGSVMNAGAEHAAKNMANKIVGNKARLPLDKFALLRKHLLRPF